MHKHQGGCHCGNVRWTLRSRLALSRLPARACQCGFCRKHGALTTSDSRGEMRFSVQDRSAIIRYRFATKTADFLICGLCGVYVGAQMNQDGQYYAIVNLRTLDGGGEFADKARPMDYSGENSIARRARRASRWTPVGARRDVGMDFKPPTTDFCSLVAVRSGRDGRHRGALSLNR